MRSVSGPRDESLLLEDITDCSQRLMDLGCGMPADYAGGDRSLNEMILWNLVVLGEAAKRLSHQVRDRFDDVEWEKMMRTRDRLTHHYEGIDWEIVQRIMTTDLPPLLPRLVEIRDTVRAEFDATEAGRGE